MGLESFVMLQFIWGFHAMPQVDKLVDVVDLSFIILFHTKKTKGKFKKKILGRY